MFIFYQDFIIFKGTLPLYIWLNASACGEPHNNNNTSVNCNIVYACMFSICGFPFIYKMCKIKINSN